MAETNIEWTDMTWNPVRGCTRVSEGCRNCYADGIAARFAGKGLPYEGLATNTPNGPRWTGKIALIEDALTAPLHWRKPRKIFVNSMSDLFHPDVPLEFIDKIFGVMAVCDRHTFQILTKRPERMSAYFADDTMRDRVCDEALKHRLWMDYVENVRVQPHLWPLKNVWLGTSVENQETADKRIPELLKVPASARFLSVEPLLGQVDLKRWMKNSGYPEPDEVFLCSHCGATGHGEFFSVPTGGDDFDERCVECGTYVGDSDVIGNINWVIVGGESGKNAGPMHPDWARSIRDQCQAAGVPFFFKQWGEWAPVHELSCNEPGIKGKEWFNFDPDTCVCRIGKKAAGRLLDGREWNEYPEVTL